MPGGKGSGLTPTPSRRNSLTERQAQRFGRRNFISSNSFIQCLIQGGGWLYIGHQYINKEKTKTRIPEVAWSGPLIKVGANSWLGKKWVAKSGGEWLPGTWVSPSKVPLLSKITGKCFWRPKIFHVGLTGPAHWILGGSTWLLRWQVTGPLKKNKLLPKSFGH